MPWTSSSSPVSASTENDRTSNLLSRQTRTRISLRSAAMIIPPRRVAERQRTSKTILRHRWRNKLRIQFAHGVVRLFILGAPHIRNGVFSVLETNDINQRQQLQRHKIR